MNLYWPHHPFRSERRQGKRRLRRWAAAEKAARTHLLVSHGNCLDGVGSAIVARKVWGDGVGLCFVQPNQMAEVLSHFAQVPGNGRQLAISDLSLQPDQFGEIVAACRRLKQGGWVVTWRDHHHKQWEGLDLSRLREHLEVLEVNADATESGASLMQKALAPEDPLLRRLAETIRDRDLWWNRTPDSETLEFALNEMGTTAFMDHVLAMLARPAPEGAPAVDAVLRDAAQRERDSQAQAGARLLGQARSHGEGERKVAVVYGWLPRNTGLHELLKDGHAMAINVRPNGKVSLRSRKDAPVCHLVAREFRGGGHPNASGADLGLKGVGYWSYVLRRGRHPVVQRMADTAVRVLRENP